MRWSCPTSAWPAATRTTPLPAFSTARRRGHHRRRGEEAGMAAGPERLATLTDAERGLLEAWLVEFDQAWQDGRLAARVAELPLAGHPLRLPALCEMVKIDLE